MDQSADRSDQQNQTDKSQSDSTDSPGQPEGESSGGQSDDEKISDSGSIKSLEEELDRKKNELDKINEDREKWTKQLENIKKESTREKKRVDDRAKKKMSERLKPTFDQLKTAMATMANMNDDEMGGQATAEQITSIKDDVKNVFEQLRNAMKSSGLKEIDAPPGTIFDPKEHEALSIQETDEQKDHHVMHQIHKGYKLHNRLIRPAQVIVAKVPRKGNNDGFADEDE